MMNIKNKLGRAAGIAAAAIGILALSVPTVASASTTRSTTAAVTTLASVSDRINGTAAAPGYHSIQNFQYGQCIDAPNGSLNVVLRLAWCNGSDTQKWALVATSSPNTYYLANRRSGYCAEVNNGTSVPGERVDEWYCDGTRAEQWIQRIRYISGVAYSQFIHAGTSMCLDTVSSAGSHLMQWYCDPNNDAQTWRVW